MGANIESGSCGKLWVSEYKSSQSMLWAMTKPDERLAKLREQCGEFHCGYEELLEGKDVGEFGTCVHTRRLTPLGSAVQVFENEAFFEHSIDGVCGYMKFYCTETIDAIGQTPISYFYQMYRNAGPAFEMIARRVIQRHADDADPNDPMNETLIGLYRYTTAAMLHVLSCELRPEYRGGGRLLSLIEAVEAVRTNSHRYAVHADNPYRRNGQPAPSDLHDWEEQFEDEIAVQLADRLSYLTLSIQSKRAGPAQMRLSEYLDSVLGKLARANRPAIMIRESEEAPV